MWDCADKFADKARFNRMAFICMQRSLFWDLYVWTNIEFIIKLFRLYHGLFYSVIRIGWDHNMKNTIMSMQNDKLSITNIAWNFNTQHSNLVKDSRLTNIKILSTVEYSTDLYHVYLKFVSQRLQKLIYLYLFAECFMRNSLQSSEQFLHWALYHMWFQK